MPAKQQTERDPMTGLVYMSKPDRGGDSAPFAKGFVGAPQERHRGQRRRPSRLGRRALHGQSRPLGLSP